MSTVNEIISSSSWLRSPLSRTAAYKVELSKSQKTESSSGETTLATPAAKWYHHIGKHSRGEAIGGVIGVGFFAWFIGDLIMKWGEGGFWRRFGLIAGGVAGGIMEAFTKPVENLFATDLITSGVLDISKKLNDKNAQESAQSAFDDNNKAIKSLTTKISLTSNDFVLLKSKIDKIIEPFDLEIDFNPDEKRELVEIYICSTSKYNHESSNPGMQYSPFITTVSLPTGLFSLCLANLLDKAESKGIANMLRSPDEITEVFNQVCSISKGGFFELKEGIKSKPNTMSIPLGIVLTASNLLSNMLNKYFRNLLTCTVKREDVNLTSEAPKLNIVCS